MMINNLTNWLASRPRKSQPTTIVLHATDGASAGSSISWLRKIGLSYHYVIERDGEITKCVPVSRVAFHAGKSFGPSGNNVNNHSVGISFANRESKGEKLTDAQVRECGKLVKELALGVPSLRYLTTHYAISPGRKTDPKMLEKTTIRVFAETAGLVVWGLK